jgi:hypothetical protein
LYKIHVAVTVEENQSYFSFYRSLNTSIPSVSGRESKNKVHENVQTSWGNVQISQQV